MCRYYGRPCNFDCKRYDMSCARARSCSHRVRSEIENPHFGCFLQEGSAPLRSTFGPYLGLSLHILDFSTKQTVNIMLTLRQFLDTVGIKDVCR